MVNLPENTLSPLTHGWKCLIIQINSSRWIWSLGRGLKHIFGRQAGIADPDRYQDGRLPGSGDASATLGQQTKARELSPPHKPNYLQGQKYPFSGLL